MYLCDCSWTSRLVPDTGYYPEVEALLGRLLLTKRSNTSQFPRLACFPSEAEKLSSVEQGQILEAIAHCLLKYQTDDDGGEDFQILETNLCQRGGSHKFLPFSVMCPKAKIVAKSNFGPIPIGNGPLSI